MNSGWIASFYDDAENWNVQIDFSQQVTDLQFQNTDRQTIVENFFLSYYYACQNNTFDRKLYSELPNDLHSILDDVYKKQLSNGDTDIDNIHEWWYELSDEEINSILEDKQIELTDYLSGDQCSNFVPLDYQIIEYDDYVRYQLFYTWTQNFPNETFFENYSQVNELIKKQNSKIFITSITSLSTISDFELHSDSIENLIDSLQFLEYRYSSENKISPETRINMGWWANDQIPNHEFMYELESLVESGIISRPSDMTVLDKIKITNIPDWLKYPTSMWYEQELSDDLYLQLLDNLFKHGIIEYELVTGST